MRRSLFGSTLGVLALAGACASGNSPETGATPQFDQPRPVSAEARDSAVAEAIANREGPRVSIHANILNTSGLRRVRADFYAEDDAYVLVGQIDAAGVLRVVFPGEPGDDGFVRGQHSYQTPEFLAGFVDQFRYRYDNSYHNAAAARDSYDGGLGYVFILASWRPLHLDRISSGTGFDSYELADVSYMNDPRAAIQELAAVLVGANSEAYTLRYARYFDTQNSYGGAGSLASNFGYGYCAGYEPFGFGFSPFQARYGFSGLVPLGQSFLYRGTFYSYDLADDCYRTQPGYSNFPYAFAAPQPPVPVIARRRNAIDAEAHQPPLRPTSPPRYRVPNVVGSDAGSPSTAPGAHASPAYRRRGLITADTPSPGPERPGSHLHATLSGDEGATGSQRPSIQQMVNRGGHSTHEGFVGSRPRAEMTDPLESPRPSISRSQPVEGRTVPRVESAPRSAPPPRIESAPPPRVEPTRSAPPPSPPPSRSEPPSSGASSGSRPIKPSHH